MDTLTSHQPLLLPLARFLGIVAPTLYCGFTLSDSLTFITPILTHAPNEKTLAKQWLSGYQYGPYWVPPLIAPGTLSNLYLAYSSNPHTGSSRNLYLAAAGLIFSILPITFFYMEPGINGACKWKAQLLLQGEEGWKDLPETQVWMPSSVKHGSTAASRRWAEKMEMKELVRFWRKVNNFRWAVGGLAAMLSGWATFGNLA